MTVLQKHLSQPLRFTPEEQQELSTVRHYLEEYDGRANWLRERGISVRDYVRTGLRDDGGDGHMSPDLEAALQKLQPAYGGVPGPGEYMAMGTSSKF